MRSSKQPRPVHSRRYPLKVIVDAKSDSNKHQTPQSKETLSAKSIRRPYVWDIYVDEAVHHRRPGAGSRTTQRPFREPTVPHVDLDLLRELEQNRAHARDRDKPWHRCSRDREVYVHDPGYLHGDEIRDMQGRLERIERALRIQEEGSEAERKYKLQLWGQEQKQAAGEKKLEIIQQEKLKRLQGQVEEEEARIRGEIKQEEALRILEERKAREKEEAIRRAAVEEYKMFLHTHHCVDEGQLRKQIEKQIWDEIEAELGETLAQAKVIIREAQAEKQGEEETRKMAATEL